MIHARIDGRELGTTEFPLEHSKVAELARALHDDDPIYRDTQAARDAGFDQIPAPPTWTVLLDHWAERGVAALAADLGADLARLLHGEVEWRYLQPVRVGQQVSAAQRVASVEKKQRKDGATMTLLKLETEFRDESGEILVLQTNTLVETSA